MFGDATSELFSELHRIVTAPLSTRVQTLSESISAYQKTFTKSELKEIEKLKKTIGIERAIAVIMYKRLLFRILRPATTFYPLKAYKHTPKANPTATESYIDFISLNL